MAGAGKTVAAVKSPAAHHVLLILMAMAGASNMATAVKFSVAAEVTAAAALLGLGHWNVSIENSAELLLIFGELDKDFAFSTGWELQVER